MSSDYMNWARTHSHARFNLATSGVPNLPFADLGATLDDLEITGGTEYGYPPLLEAIAARHGVAVENVVTAAGTSMANHLAMAALVEPGDEVLVERPVYDPITSAAAYLGAELRYFHRRPEDGHRVDPDEIARLVTGRTRLVVLTNLHNPTSALTDDDTLARVGAAARRVGARVLVDEVYLDAAFDDTPRSAVHLGPDYVVTNSLTKVYGLSGLRCGWILADAETARRMWRLNDLFGVSGPHVADRLAVVAFKKLDELRERARVLLDANRRTLYAFYDTRGELDAERIAWGTTSFPRLREGSVARLCDLLRERYETTVVPGSFFGADDHFRVGLTSTPETLEAGLDRLGRALDELTG
jgi:aspartate/methionine/tyrosine aminotransferase